MRIHHKIGDIEMTNITITHYLKMIVTLALAIFINYTLISVIVHIEQIPYEYYIKTIYNQFTIQEFYYIEYLNKYSLIAIILLILINSILVIRSILMAIGYSKIKKSYE